MKEETKKILCKMWPPIIEELVTHKTITSGWLFPYKDGTAFVQADYSNDAEKKNVLGKLNAMIRKAQPPWLVMATDAWVSTSPNVRPSLAPNKTEAILFQVIDPSGEVSFARMQHYKRQNGDIVLNEVYDMDKRSKQFMIQPWQQENKQ
jgi:hypothetical protein